MQAIPYRQFPADELVLGLITDPKTGTVEKRARVRTKMPISTKGRLLDKCGGSQIQSAFLSMIRGSRTVEDANREIETLRPRFENEMMLAVLESLGDNIEPHRTVSLRLSTVDRDLIIIRHVIEKMAAKGEKYHYNLACSVRGIGACKDPRTGSPTPLKGSLDLRDVLTVRVPSPDEVFALGDRWATFDSAPSKQIDSFKATMPTCNDEEASKEKGRADESFGPEYYLYGQTIADFNGRRLSESDIRAMDEDEFLAIKRLWDGEKRQLGVDTKLRIQCPRCGGENTDDFFVLLSSLVGWGLTPLSTDEKRTD